MARNSNQESSTKGVDPFSIRLISKREFICGSKKWTENGYQKIFHPKNNFCTQGRSSIPYPNTLLHLKSRDEPQAIGPKTLNAPLSVHYTLGILDAIGSDTKKYIQVIPCLTRIHFRQILKSIKFAQHDELLYIQHDPLQPH